MASKVHGTRRVTVICVAGVALAAASAWGAEVPVAVSPGSDSELVRVEARCPTFSWGAVVGAQRYELVVYRVGDGGEEARAVLEQAIAGAALSWTPSLGGCLERGGRYAWSVRALGGGGEGEWSPPMWFEVATAGVGRDSGVAVGRAEQEGESAGGRQGAPVSTQAARSAAVGARSGARSEGRAAGESRGGQGADAASASPQGSAGPDSKGHSIRSDTPSLALTQADTPSLRIHQTVGAFPDQEWGLVGNELAFEIRDVTGVTSPVVIEPAAPTHSLTVEAGGVVASGAGFRFPDGSLQTKAAGGSPAPVPESGQTTCWDAGGTVISCAGTGRTAIFDAGWRGRSRGSRTTGTGR